MRLYTQPHRFYCGIDLHARTLFLHVLDQDGQTRFEKNIPARPDAVLDAVKPYRDGLIVGVECMFAWYWLADLCRDQGLAFVLGHALYMGQIRGQIQYYWGSGQIRGQVQYYWGSGPFRNGRACALLLKCDRPNYSRASR